jgi:hypothetical protein
MTTDFKKWIDQTAPWLVRDRHKMYATFGESKSWLCYVALNHGHRSLTWVERMVHAYPDEAVFFDPEFYEDTHTCKEHME